MPKTNHILFAFLLVFLLSITTVAAQTDDGESDGITVEEDRMMPEVTPAQQAPAENPQIELIAPAPILPEDFDTRITGLKAESMKAISINEAKYKNYADSQKTLEQSQKTTEAQIEKYKANVILVAARYHAAVGLQYSFLVKMKQLASKTEDDSGFANPDTPAVMDTSIVEQQIAAVTASATQLEDMTNQEVGASDEERILFSQQTMSQSQAVKNNLMIAQQSLQSLLQSNL